MFINHKSKQPCNISCLLFAGSSVDPPPVILQYKLVCVDLAKVIQDEGRIGEQGIKDAGKNACNISKIKSVSVALIGVFIPL